MAKRTEAEAPAGAASAEPGVRTVADWTKALGVRKAIVAGAAHLAGWKPDTRLTRKEFEAGVAKFTETPMGG